MIDFKNLPNHDYLISKKMDSKFNKCFEIGDYRFQYRDSDAIQGLRNDKNIILFGKIINSRAPHEAVDEILDRLLESDNLIDLINNSKKLAGRFIIVYFSKEGFFIIPDASASIHVAYTTLGNDLYVSSNPKIIGDINGFKESAVSKGIKASAAETHPLPYDMSMYDNIKFVIPNHYLDINSRRAVRYYPIARTVEITVNEAVNISNELIGNIIKGYHSKHKLSLPFTSGIDSRTILSVCRDIIRGIPTFVFFHDDFTDDTADVLIPKKISNRYKFNYIILKDLELPEEITRIYIDKLGGSINKDEAKNAWTYYNSELVGHKRLDGNISPLAKSNFGRNLPEFLATPFYLVTKTHNYSKENYREIKRWSDNISKYSATSGISKYDLFFWEHRVGKWTANSFMNFELLAGSLNPFNCRMLIETWLSVPRKGRCDGGIHKGIIRINWPELLDFPINPDQKFRILYKNSFLFYFGSIVKYILGRNKI